jgi:hypothetical protein
MAPREMTLDVFVADDDFRLVRTLMMRSQTMNEQTHFAAASSKSGLNMYTPEATPGCCHSGDKSVSRSLKRPPTSYLLDLRRCMAWCVARSVKHQNLVVRFWTQIKLSDYWLIVLALARIDMICQSSDVKKIWPILAQKKWLDWVFRLLLQNKCVRSR